MGTLSNDPVVVAVPDQPLQFPSSSSIEFFNITFVARQPWAPLDPIMLYSGLVPVEQFNELQKVTDFFSSTLMRFGAQVEVGSLVSQFLGIIQSQLSKETSADCKELPVKASLDLPYPEFETEEEARAVATNLGLPNIVLENGFQEDQECAICVSELLSGCRVTQLSCSHVYHTRCILKWLYQKPDEYTCPLCRHNIIIQYTESNCDIEEGRDG